jgi:hypothetical protein
MILIYVKKIFIKNKPLEFFEFIKIMKDRYKNAQSNAYDDLTKLKNEISSIPERFINIIVKKKLIPSDEIDKYIMIVNQCKIMNQDILK